MSDEDVGGLSPESGQPEVEKEPSSEQPRPAPRGRFRWLRRGVFFVVISSLVLLCVLVSLFIFASSPVFENSVRKRLITSIQDMTGGRVEVSRFHWDILSLSVEANGITIHGLEAAGEAPYAHIERLRLQFGILDLFRAGSPTHVILHHAEILQPSLHLIVYPDGTTNQPHPLHPKPQRPAMDTLFDAQIGQLVVEQGSLNLANQVVPLNLRATDADLQLNWVPDKGMTMSGPKGAPGMYRIHLSLANLAFAQQKAAPVPTRVDADLMLLRDSLRLDRLRLTALGQTFTVKGTLADFARPVWQAEASGEIDLRILEPVAAFPFAREGVVHLSTQVHGHRGEFISSGELSSREVHYQDPVVDARTSLSARFQADAHLLTVSAIHTHLVQGGEADGELHFENWLAMTPAPAAAQAMRRAHQTWPVPTGKINATLHDISLDTLLAMMAAPNYRHFGLQTKVSGPATADWTGMGLDLSIDGQLALNPGATPVAGEAPVTGSVDGVWHESAGAVDVRSIDLQLPRSSLHGSGSVVVAPIERASQMDLDFHSSDLSEFDAVLRTLNFHQGNRKGTAALPFALKGQLAFRGTLSSTWLTPRLDGHAIASNIDLQMPTASTDPDAPPKWVHWDSVDAVGMYSPASIVVRQSALKRGKATLQLQGHIDSPNPNYNVNMTADEFGNDSPVALKATAQQVSVADLLTLAEVKAPLDGTLSGQVDLKGLIRSVAGTGDFDIVKAKAYGTAIDHVHLSGTVNGPQLKISSLLAEQSGGRLTATGSYNLVQHSFTVDARGAAIDLASQTQLRQAGVAVNGKLGLTITGEGTLEDPRVQARGSFTGLTMAGDSIADVMFSASSRQHQVTYDFNSRQLVGTLTAHGTTSLDAAMNTQANLKLTRFDIGALLKMLNVTGISGQSDLEGTATLAGSLAHIDKLGGEAHLEQLAVVIQGVHLQSKMPVLAVLKNGVIHLDPVEITGEDTDMKLNGSLDIAGKQQLDLQASGAVNLRLAESLDPDLIASGATSFQMEAHGPLTNPILQGSVQFQNAALALQDFPNGLSQIKGTLEFVQNRLEVRSLTALSGGGQLSVGGYIGFQKGLYADLTVTGKSIRVRYPQGISSLADATLRLQGPQNNLLLSGTVEVTRFAINADLDMAAFAAQSTSVQAITSPDAPSNHIRLDVHLTSAPQLNFQNAYAKLAGDVDLHLRGTIASPSLLGRISLTEGSTSLGGTKYELQRGDINFTNPVRIQPNIDLDATARVEDYDITLGLHGTPDRLKVTYRSEPPLPEADVIALLALGRTSDEQMAYAQQQQQAGDNPTTDALLGGALNATVSNRVQKLFGSGAIKVDPNFIGSLGNSTARVTVVEQIGKNLTFTYASNVNTTTQQLIQAEIAINRHVSLLVTQDESGIFSMVIKARRRFR